MNSRCHNPKASKYEYYGARGIVVCDEWRNDFEAFLRFMGLRPSPKHSIERDKGDVGYEPGNCRWATKIEQANNRRNNRMLTFNGRTMSMADWARELGIGRATLKMRLKSGWSVEETLSLSPSRTRRAWRHDT